MTAQEKVRIGFGPIRGLLKGLVGWLDQDIVVEKHIAPSDGGRPPQSRWHVYRRPRQG